VKKKPAKTTQIAPRAFGDSAANGVLTGVNSRAAFS
jgi:hypothetical protein